MALPPTLTDEQRHQALQMAAEARRARAEVKEKLKMGSISLSEVFDLADGDEVIAKTKVLAILESVPGIGKVKARKTMQTIGIADTRRIRGLGDRQRSELLAEFG
jgi:hypothetical protein